MAQVLRAECELRGAKLSFPDHSAAATTKLLGPGPEMLTEMLCFMYLRVSLLRTERKTGF